MDDSDMLVQICAPVTGWYAVYSLDDGTEDWTPLALWGLFKPRNIEDELGPYVEGIDMQGTDADSRPCSEIGNFLRYDVEKNREP
jgi:hypothetical protein